MGKTDAFTIGTLSYFPASLKAEAGSTIDFESVFTGEPHTVTFGTLVDEGMKELKAAGEEAEDEPASLQKLPPLLPDGPGDANQMAANPCFIDSGDPPTDKACPKREQPEFDGTQSVYNSGFLPEGARFEVKLADDIAAGTYTYFCLLHRGGMVGTVEVVESGADTPETVEKAGQAGFDTLVNRLKPIAEEMKKGALADLVPAAPGQVLAGGASAEVEAALVQDFGPKELSIKTGSSVTWVVVGPHTVSFNAPEDLASSAIIKGPDGAFHANEKVFAPAGGPGAPEGPPSDGPPGPPKIVDGGRFDGSGFRSSGIFLSFPPSLLGYKLTFTKAGTYPYECLIHPGMEGTVKVA